MHSNNKTFKIAFTLMIAILLSGCEKYLDVKSNSVLVIPQSPGDLQALLDHFTKINQSGASAGEMSSDDYYVSENDFQSLPVDQRKVYTWEGNNLFSSNDNDWVNSYNKIFIANTVLDNIPKLYLKGYDVSTVNDIKGQALFIRSYSLLQVAIAFSPAYNSNTAAGDLGIPLRLTSDINEEIKRASLEQTFERIIKDLIEATQLLNLVPAHVLRASKPASFALLARTYLYMGKYDKCFAYADSAIQIKQTLLSFNPPEIPNINAKFPFNASSLLYNNPEILFASRMSLPKILNSTIAKVDTNLTNLYENTDNRKSVLFSKIGTSDVFMFKGSYEGNANLFDGLATDEVYLMRSESLARLNDIGGAMKDLNFLLRKRSNDLFPYNEIIASNQEEALNIILIERRKSLVMRGLRWMDIKRLNIQGANITLRRMIGGTEYILPPNDLKFAIAIPESIISISKIPQNPR